MKTNKLFQTVLLMVGILLLVQCCKPDDTCCDPSNPECENYDPCYGENPTSADFKFYAQVGIAANMEWREEPYFNGGNVKFAATDTTADSYTWYLGVDTFTNATSVVLNTGNLSNGIYGASLVVEKTPNTDCFPDDTGRDSLYQTFTKVSYCDVLVYGTFRGVLNSQTDSMDIQILKLDPSTFEPCTNSSVLFCINLFGNSDTLLTVDGPFTYSKLYLSGNGSGDPRGTLEVNPENNETVLEYEFGWEDYIFKGRKIQ